MSRYCVDFGIFYIDANSPEEAEEVAKQMLASGEAQPIVDEI